MRELTEVRVPKSSGTYADALKAVGMATLLDEFEGRQGLVTISDAGHEYVVTPSQPVVDCSKEKLSVGYRYLSHAKAKTAPEGLFPSPYPYVEEKRKEEAWDKYQEMSNASGGRRKKIGEELSLQPPRPDVRFTLMKVLNSLRSGSESWNDLASLIQERLTPKLTTDTGRHEANSKGAFVKLVLGRMQGARAEKESEPQWSVSVLQTFAPTAGKGVNRAKPDGARLDNLKEPWADWFEEWIKYRAVWYVLSGRFAGKEGKDVKLAALLPGTRVSLSALRNLADEFVRASWLASGRAYTNVKADVFSLLGLTRWLIQHSEFAPVRENRLYKFLKTSKPQQPRPRDVVAGLATAYFKSLGTGRALSNTNSLFLPDWFPLTEGTYERWLAVLDEHRQVLTYLDEEKAEEATLLVAYRDAVSENDLEGYLEFFADHGANVMRCRDRNSYTGQFTLARLEMLVMGLTSDWKVEISAVVKDSAFLALADAVHEGTVKAQYWKGQGKPDYEIHYGLAQRWKRAADQGPEFVQVLGDFVRAYNEENAKRKEKPKRAIFLRDDVARSDLDRVLEYVTSGRVDTRTLCLLLLAYGFAMTDEELERAQAAREKPRDAEASET
jgi:hypothetical protein